MSGYHGVFGGLGELARRSAARTRSISAENPTGAKGLGGMATEGTGAAAAGELGRGWKVSPSIELASHSTAELADIAGPGAVQHIWMTAHPRAWRSTLLRMYWEDAELPAVEVPLGDFFGQGWGRFAQLGSLPVAVNPNGGLNCYWPMPFRRRARITLENLADVPQTLYYQITWAEGADGAELPEDSAYLHAQWRRSNPLVAGQVHTLLDGVSGAGHYAGTYLAWGVNSPGWWGEGELKFYLDGDEEFPTICGTGTEDYFGGAWNFDVPGEGYTAFCTPFLGLHQILPADGLYASQQRFGMYRWHVMDPVRFEREARVTVQALGIGPARGGGEGVRYRPLHDDIASTALYYLDDPSGSAERPAGPGLTELEVD